MIRSTDERGRALLALTAVQILFGVHYGVALEIVAEIPPSAWALLRSTGATAVLLVLVTATGRRWPRGSRTWFTLLGLSFLGVTVNQVLFIEGLSRSTSIHSVLIMGTIPLQTLLLSALTRHEIISRPKLVSVLLGAVGLLVLLRVDELVSGSSGNWLLRSDGAETDRFFETVLSGDLMMLVNAFSFSLFLVLSKKPSGSLDPVVMTAAIFLLGTGGVAVVGGPTLLQTDLGAVSAVTWALGAFTVLGPTVGTYGLNLYAMKRVSPSLVGLFIYLQFVIAATLGVTWREERLDARLVVASGLVLAGIALRVRSATIRVAPRAQGGT